MIFQSDLIIKAAVELGLEDIRNNLWLIDDILGDVINNTYLREKYGQKQVSACKEWFKNNQVEVYMENRNDRDKLPCVTISLGSSQEKDDRKTMADQSTESVILLPSEINKPIGYVIKPFDFISYDNSTGLVAVPAGTNLTTVAPGMILVDPQTGKGYIISDVTLEGIIIEASLGAISPAQAGVVPQFQFYKARIEHTFFQETYNIGCHAHGDPQAVLWLHSIVLYSLLRYREGLFEANGFSESVLANSDLSSNPAYTGPGGEQAYSRYITLSGLVENSWIKSPRRFIESVALREKVTDGYLGGIKILSNTDPDDIVEQTDSTWYPVLEEE
jgi:hypothetical protein